MDYTATYTRRAQRLRTNKQTTVLEGEQRQRDEQTHGLTKQQYWQKYVKTKDDVVRYYKVFFPQYPDHLVDAIALRIQNLIEKCHAGQDLTNDERQYFTKQESADWDPKKELQEQELAAKIQLAMKKLETLLE